MLEPWKEAESSQACWLPGSEAAAFEMAVDGGCSPEPHMSAGLGWTQAPMKILQKTAEGVHDKGSHRQSEEAERGGWDPAYQEVFRT